MAVWSLGYAFHLPVLSSVDSRALLLSIAAVLAIYRFGVGMLTALAGSAATGITLYLMGLTALGRAPDAHESRPTSR